MQDFYNRQDRIEPTLENYYHEPVMHHTAKIPLISSKLVQQKQFAAKNLLQKMSEIPRIGTRAIIK